MSALRLRIVFFTGTLLGFFAAASPAAAALITLSGSATSTVEGYSSFDPPSVQNHAVTLGDSAWTNPYLGGHANLAATSRADDATADIVLTTSSRTAGAPQSAEATGEITLQITLNAHAYYRFEASVDQAWSFTAAFAGHTASAIRSDYAPSSGTMLSGGVFVPVVYEGFLDAGVYTLTLHNHASLTRYGTGLTSAGEVHLYLQHAPTPTALLGGVSLIGGLMMRRR